MSENDSSSGWDNIIDDFIKHINVLKNTAPIVLDLLSMRILKSSRILNGYVEQKGIEKVEDEDEEGKKQLLIPKEAFSRFIKLDEQLSDSFLALKMLPVNFVVSLVSQFDAYLGKLIRQIFEIQPEILNSSEKLLKFSDLTSFEDIDEAKEYIIEKEIESVLRESHINHFVWLERKLDIPLRKDLPSFLDFIEITERRNLFVHTNGVVSRQYLSVCQKNCPKLVEDISIGDKLNADTEYLVKSQEIIFEIGVKLGHVMWRKLMPDDLENADKHLNMICYDLLQSGDFRLSQNLLHFSTKILRKHSNDEIMSMQIINHALSYYLMGDKKKCKQILKSKDWSASNDKFLLAIDVLKDNYDSAKELMISIGANNNHLTKEAYREWPLFNAFRESDQFLSAYEEIFDEKFKFMENEPLKLESILDEINHFKKTTEEIKKDKSGDD